MRIKTTNVCMAMIVVLSTAWGLSLAYMADHMFR